MSKFEYSKGPTSKAFLLENREEKKLIHQFHHRGQEIELENVRGKYTLNEIR